MAVLAMGAAMASWVLFWQPRGVHPSFEGRVDAVVMFGGSGPRFERARALMEAEVAATLVISDPNDPATPGDRTDFEAFCAGVHAYETVCFDPEPRTTRGESRFVATLARAEGWRHIVVVTTVEQASRARLLLGRCWDGTVDVVVVDSERNRLGRVVYEWAATTRAAVLRRGC